MFKAKEAAETTQNYELIAKIYGSISHQYVQPNLDDKAKEYLNKAIAQTDKLAEGNTKKMLRGLSYLELGNIGFDEKKYGEANNNYKRSLKQFESIKNLGPVVYHYRRSLYNIGKSYVYTRKNDSAEWYLNKALAVKDDKNKELKLYIYSALSEVYSGNGFTQRAIDSLKVVLKDANLKDAKLRTEVYSNLAQNYKKQGNYKEYVTYNEKYVRLENSLKEKELKAISSAINAEQKDFKSVIIKADKTNKQIIYLGIFFGFLFMLVMLYLIIKKKKEKTAYELIIGKLLDQSGIQLQKATAVPVKAEKNPMPSAVENDILNRLLKFEASQKFLNPKLNISTVAIQLKTNTTYLSEVINQYKGKNFNTYINDLRITYICEKIYNSQDYQKYKISYLAEECGFTSHSAFTKVFKNTTGISPSVFLREAAKKTP